MPKRPSIRDRPMRARPEPRGRQAIYTSAPAEAAAVEAQLPPAEAASVEAQPAPAEAAAVEAQALPAEPAAVEAQLHPAEAAAVEAQPPPAEPAAVEAQAPPAEPAAVERPPPQPDVARELQPAEATIVLKCQQCGTENQVDSIYCRICGKWLVRQWDSVLVIGGASVAVTMKVGPGTRVIAVSRRFSLKTSLAVGLQISGGPAARYHRLCPGPERKRSRRQ